MLTDAACWYSQWGVGAGAVLTDHELAQAAGVAAEVVRAALGGAHHGLMVAACLPYADEQQELLAVDGYVDHVTLVHVEQPGYASCDVDLASWVERHVWTSGGVKYSLHDGVLLCKGKGLLRSEGFISLVFCHDIEYNWNVYGKSYHTELSWIAVSDCETEEVYAVLHCGLYLRTKASTSWYLICAFSAQWRSLSEN